MISVYRINAFGGFKPRPSDFQYILSPFSAMWHLEREYDLYDGTYIWQGRTFNEWNFIPERRHGYGYQGSRHSHPNRIWTLTEKLLKSGELIVCDSTHGWDSGLYEIRDRIGTDRLDESYQYLAQLLEQEIAKADLRPHHQEELA